MVNINGGFSSHHTCKSHIIPLQPPSSNGVVLFAGNAQWVFYSNKKGVMIQLCSVVDSFDMWLLLSFDDVVVVVVICLCV